MASPLTRKNSQTLLEAHSRSRTCPTTVPAPETHRCCRSPYSAWGIKDHQAQQQFLAKETHIALEVREILGTHWHKPCWKCLREFGANFASVLVHPAFNQVDVLQLQGRGSPSRHAVIIRHAKKALFRRSTSDRSGID